MLKTIILGIDEKVNDTNLSSSIHYSYLSLFPSFLFLYFTATMIKRAVGNLQRSRDSERAIVPPDTIKTIESLVLRNTCYEGMEDEAWGGSEASHMHIAQAVEQVSFS